MWILIVIIIIVIGVYSYFIYNKLIDLNNKTNELYKNLDIFFKRRIDFLPTLENIFNRYNLEKDTIDKINFLIKNYNTKTVLDKININEALNDLIDHLYNVSSSNMILKQNPIFINVIRQFNIIENELVISKNLYNKEIKKYNKLYKYNYLIGKLLNYNLKYICNIDETKRKKIDTNENKREPIVLGKEKKKDLFDKYEDK